MTQEIELKFNFNSKDIDHLLAYLCSTVKIVQEKNIFLFNYYYDTDTLDLQQQKIALRIRKVDDKFFLTIKAKEQVNNGLFEREEWEMQIFENKITMELLPQKWQKILEPFSSKLKPIFATNFQRHIWLIELLNSIEQNLTTTKLEVAFDKGDIIAKNKKEKISELEIELIEGNKNAMLEFALNLQKTLSLIINNKSKAKRGYELLFCDV